MARGAHWSAEENVATVAAYLEMLTLQFRTEAYRKVDFTRRVAEQTGRSTSAVEYKFRNVSAALQRLDLPWIPGFTPADNLQRSLLEETMRQFQGRTLEDDARDFVLAEPPQPQAGFEFTTTLPPERVDFSSFARHRRALKLDYRRLEAANRELGLRGEQAVVTYERQRLIRAGREDLAARVRHASVDEGDGLGYDIASYDLSGETRFIEVKTTRRPSGARFYVSRNEVEFSREEKDRFSLYRVSNFTSDSAKIFTLDGAIDETCELTPTEFLAQARAPLAAAPTS